MLWVNNGISIKSLRPLRTIYGRLTLSTSKAMVDQITSDVPLPTQDGGSYSDTKELLSRMKEERSWKSKEMLTKKTETSESTMETMDSINNGTSSTLTNGKVNQEKENLTKSSDFTLKDHSTLFLSWLLISSWISSTIETLSLRPQMEETPKFGTSISNL
jgi:hypothetical protein